LARARKAANPAIEHRRGEGSDGRCPCHRRAPPSAPRLFPVGPCALGGGTPILLRWAVVTSGRIGGGAARPGENGGLPPGRACRAVPRGEAGARGTGGYSTLRKWRRPVVPAAAGGRGARSGRSRAMPRQRGERASGFVCWARDGSSSRQRQGDRRGHDRADGTTVRLYGNDAREAGQRRARRSIVPWRARGVELLHLRLVEATTSKPAWINSE
jgi:hypothetical protein